MAEPPPILGGHPYIRGAIEAAQRIGGGLDAVLRDLPLLSLGEAVAFPAPAIMSGDQLHFQLFQLVGRQVVVDMSTDGGATWFRMGAKIRPPAAPTAGPTLRFSAADNGLAATEGWRAAPFETPIPPTGDEYRVRRIVASSVHLSEVIARLQAVQAPAQSELVNSLVAALNLSPIRAPSPNNASASQLAEAIAATRLATTAAENQWLAGSVRRAMLAASAQAPLSNDEVRAFRSQDFAGLHPRETREVGLLLALARLLERAELDAAYALINERLRLYVWRYGAEKNADLAEQLEAALMADLHAAPDGCVSVAMLKAQAPAPYQVATAGRAPADVVPPGLPARPKNPSPSNRKQTRADSYPHGHDGNPLADAFPTLPSRLAPTKPLVGLTHSSPCHIPPTRHCNPAHRDSTKSPACPQRGPHVAGQAATVERRGTASETPLAGGARYPKCSACGSRVDEDGDCTAAACSTHRTRAEPPSLACEQKGSKRTSSPKRQDDASSRTPPAGLPNTDGSCALNAALTAISALRDRIPKRSAVDKLLHGAWNGETTAKTAIAERLRNSGWNFNPGRSCARECIVKLLELAPSIRAQVSVIDVATTYEGAAAPGVRFVPNTIGAVFFKGPPPGHWVGATLRDDQWYIVDDLRVSQRDPGPGYELAAVLVETAGVDKVEALLKQQGGRTDNAATARTPCTATSKKGRRCVAPALTGHDLCAAHLYPAGASAICSFRAAGGKSCGNWAASGFAMCGQHIESTCRANHEPFPTPPDRPHATADIDPVRQEAALASAPAALAAAAAAYTSPPRASVQPQTPPPPYFRVGHQSSVPLVTMMTGADLVALTQSRKDLAALSDTYMSGISVEQRRDHLKWLQKLHEMPERHRPRPLPEAVLATMRMYRLMGRPWKDTTWARALGTVDGALRRLSIYTDSVIDVNLSRTSAWQDAARQASKLKKSQHKRKAIPATLQEVNTTVTRLTAEHAPDRALQLALMWSTCARPGCTLQLKAEDVHLDNEATGDVTIIFRRGKRQELGLGPLPVHTRLPAEWFVRLKQHLKETSPTSFMWSFPSRDARFAAVTVLTHDLRKTNPRLEARSLRVGSLRAMAEAQISEERMLEFSGHQTVESLREYISYSEIVKDRAKTMRRAAAHLLSGPP